MSTNLWDHESPITDLDIDVPAWIEQDISPSDVAAILQGGCASGAYMPAVTYHTALATMAEHGDEILDYIDAVHCSDPAFPAGTSWAGMACHYVSTAVELWATSIESELETALEAIEGEA